MTQRVPVRALRALICDPPAAHSLVCVRVCCRLRVGVDQCRISWNDVPLCPAHSRDSSADKPGLAAARGRHSYGHHHRPSFRTALSRVTDVPPFGWLAGYLCTILSALRVTPAKSLAAIQHLLEAPVSEYAPIDNACPFGGRTDAGCLSSLVQVDFRHGSVG